MLGTGELVEIRISPAWLKQKGTEMTWDLCARAKPGLGLIGDVKPLEIQEAAMAHENGARRK